MPPADPSPAPAEPPCCAIAEQLTPARLETLEACLRGFGGAQGSIRKLALQFGVDRGTLGSHKRRCLGLAPVSQPVSQPQGAESTARQGGERIGEASRLASAPTSDGPRARALAKSAETRSERVAYLASRLARGKDKGLLTYLGLAEVWGVGVGLVREMASEAKGHYLAGLGDTTHMAARSLAMGDRVQSVGFEAVRLAREQKDPRALAAAGALIEKAQAGKDRAAGVGVGRMGAVVQSPEFQLLVAEIRSALVGIPGAWEAVQSHMAGALARRRAAGEWAELVGMVEGGGEGRG